MAIVVGGAPTVSAGDTESISGAGLVTRICSVPETPPPGWGFATLTRMTRGTDSSAEASWVLASPGPDTVVIWTASSIRICDSPTNPRPMRVIAADPDPRTMVAGLTASRIGAGLGAGPVLSPQPINRQITTGFILDFMARPTRFGRLPPGRTCDTQSRPHPTGGGAE